MTVIDIQPGKTYTVRFEGRGLSSKRFRDAVNFVREIGRCEGSAASYDAGTKTWTVTLACDARTPVHNLGIVQRSYDAIVAEVCATAVAPGTGE